MESEINKSDVMDLTLEEMGKGISIIEKFVMDMEKSKIGVVIKDSPDFSQIYNILNNLSLLVEEYKRDVYEEYGHTHDK